MTNFTTGDRVAMRASWLRNTGQLTGPPAPTSVGPFARGTVTGTHPLGARTLVAVRWDDGRESRVISGNLAAVGPNLRFADPIYQG